MSKAKMLNKKCILVDILHPAHVHFFRNIMANLSNSGYEIIFTAREKEMTTELLDLYNLKYYLISKQKNGLGLIFEMISRTLKLIAICLKKKPALLVGIMGPSISVVGAILRIPAWVYYDTENAWITNWFAYPLASRVYSPSCYLGKIRKNQILYPGYHELCYLHPDNFTPENEKLTINGLSIDKPFSLVRFVSWQASHDAGENGLNIENKRKIINALQKYGDVYISSEGMLPEDLKKHELNINKTDVHHLLAFAKIVIGESATMASEAAVLGTPAIYISDTHRGYTVEQEEKYGLVFNLTRSEMPRAIELINEVMENYSEETWKSKQKKLLSEKVNAAEYLYKTITEFIEG